MFSINLEKMMETTNLKVQEMNSKKITKKKEKSVSKFQSVENQTHKPDSILPLDATSTTHQVKFELFHSTN